MFCIRSISTLIKGKPQLWLENCVIKKQAAFLSAKNFLSKVKAAFTAPSFALAVA